MIKALIFDFDGLIVETEEPIFRAWQRIYREHGQELPLEMWVTIIGTASGPFDPIQHLEERVGRLLDRKGFEDLERRYYEEATAMQRLMPGVAEYLRDAHRLRLGVGIASSSRRAWVVEHLKRFAIADAFDAIVCREEVAQTKPDPQLYLEAVKRLMVMPEEALALEDSSNGIAAAKVAGLRCVAVPTVMTAGLDLSRADMRIPSLGAVPLTDLLAQIG
ncbi:MAG TPA: HAD family hydrolase [Candidatus Eisenbacteria bacterium]|nr:HAD family hydrolase [Candidatus Eisenbacteria bacterium]